MQAAHGSEVAALEQEVTELHEQIAQLSRELSTAREAGSRLDEDYKNAQENTKEIPFERENPKSELKIKITTIKHSSAVRSVSF